ncbi:MAG: hypothetical protein ACKVOW_05750, partial [Chitinophagaceae bacterium]
MTLKFYRFFVTLFFLFIVWKTSAQISGSYTVPGSYVSLASAINALNSQSIVGPTTINVAAGYTETVPNGGYTLTATGTSLNPIYFKKLGAGANPLLLAYAGGTATPSSIKQDGIWVLAGSDYVTIDGFTLKDANTINPATMEYGIRLVRFNSNNGCKFNTIQNCDISLKMVNAAMPGSYNAGGSRGIEISSESIFGAPTATSVAGANSFNRFYSNVIKRCNVAIALNGDNSSALLYNDSNNDIGGLSQSTGNTVTKFGAEPSAFNPAAIYLSNQLNANVSYNYINNDTIVGQNNVDIYGVYLLNDPGSSGTINSNTVSLSTGSVNVNVHPILRSAGISIASGTVSISNNLISGCTTSLQSSPFSCIENSSKASQLDVSGNVFTNIAKSAGTQPFYNIRNTGNITASLTVSNNVISNHTVNILGAGDGYHGIYSLGSNSLCSVNIYSNSMQSLTLTGTGGLGPFHFIYCDGTVAVSVIESNSVSNVVINSGNINAPMIHSGGVTGNSSVLNNAIQNVTVGTAFTPNSFYVIEESSSSPSGSITVTGNLLKNIWTNNLAPCGINVGSPKKSSIASNTLSAITVSTATQAYGIFAIATTTNVSITNNLIENISAGSVWGINSNNLISGVIQSNTVHALSGQNGVIGVHVGGRRPKILNNKCYDLATSGFSGLAEGIYAIVGWDTAFISNNLIGDLKAPNAYGTEPVRGIELYCSADTGYFKVSYNTIYLNASSTSALFGTSGITHYATVIPTQGRLYLNNNIIVNNSVSNGGEFTAALRRTGGTSGNYDPSSNNNLFYAGPSSSTSALYMTGITFTTLASMKAFLSPRESASVRELPPFLTTNGNNAFYLKLNSLIATQAESGGQPIAGILSDYIGTLRNSFTPDIGAWEGSYTPLDSAAPLI